ncbi:hypothetical protein BDR06DRAFT_564199 [Suillus hirtellus]|nr:hypothetical protein BDR06DRAFT_564199 [Suillus hirtellus]
MNREGAGLNDITHHKPDATATVDATRGLSMSQYSRVLGAHSVVIHQDARPPNLRSESSADVYQTCLKLSMNIQASATGFSFSTNQRGRCSSPVTRTAPTALSPLGSYPEPPSSGENSKRTEHAKHHGISPFQTVSHIPTCSFCSQTSKKSIIWKTSEDQVYLHLHLQRFRTSLFFS